MTSSAPKSFRKRDELRELEVEAQKQWDALKLYEVDANPGKEKYFVTFPYPYMNGKLHLGHAFTISKAEFMARFQRLQGKEVIFPFGFHCTGMPIKAAADKLSKEIEKYGNPPNFPPPKSKEELEKEAREEEERRAELSKTDPTKFTAKKAKVQGKKAAGLYQWQIMETMELGEDVDIARFADPMQFLRFFPPKAMKDLDSIGMSIDWRRTFITTPANPYYDSFVRWQFTRMHEKNCFDFGKRFTIWSPSDNQPCMDHDRSKGEGVGVQEYTLIKMRVKKPFPEALAALKDRTVTLLCATLRPETMYGQTNCWVLPEGDYGAFESGNAENEVYVCTERAAQNLSFQENANEFGKVDKICDLSGMDLIGAPLSAPLTKYETIHVLPMTTVSCDKGTGIVTSVPADSPDDYTMLREIKKKMAYFTKTYGVKEEWVTPFEVIPIIHTTKGDLTAMTVVEESKKIQGIKSREGLDEAKAIAYKLGFYEGTMLVGEHAGKPVQDVKPLVRQQLIDCNDAIAYAEPAAEVVSRSGDVCVVCLTDQWYVKYGDEEWRAKVQKCLDGMNLFDSKSRHNFDSTLEWLRDWAVSRTYGLGTVMPWDDRYLIESLSDSTIYMAYYTVSHMLHSDLFGEKEGTLGIKAEDLSYADWDFVFLKTEYNGECNKVEKEKLEKMRAEFEYWYPFDLRVSGKDLARNHMLFCMYAHTTLWPEEKWPKAFRLNGHLMVDGEKMAKSKGNFVTMAQAVDWDGDANFTKDNVTNGTLIFHTELAFVKEVMAMEWKDVREMRFADKVFDAQISQIITRTQEAYEGARFAAAMVEACFNLTNARDAYRNDVGTENMSKPLIMRYLEVIAIILSPVIPHWSEAVWKLIGKEGSVTTASWPTFGEIDVVVLKQHAYILRMQEIFRQKHRVFMKQIKKKPPPTPATSAVIRYNAEVPEWTDKTVDILPHQHFPQFLREVYDKNEKEMPPFKEVLGSATKKFKEDPATKKHMKFVVAFVKDICDRVRLEGDDAFETRMIFNEEDLLKTHLSALETEFGCPITIMKEDGKTKKDSKPGFPTINFDRD